MSATSAIVHALRYGNNSTRNADPASLARRAYQQVVALLGERYPEIPVDRLDDLLHTDNGQADFQRRLDKFDVASDLDILLRIIELQDALAQYPTPGAIGLAMENIHAERIEISGIAVTQIQGAAPPTPGQSPYKGLSYFDVADAPLFFGREKLTAHLVQRLWDHRFLAVVGASGSGKSSLVRAGLIPTLLGQKALADDGDRPSDSASWRHLIITPKEDGLVSLAQGLARQRTGMDWKEIAAEMQTDPTTLNRAVEKWMKADTSDEHLLLVIDQFEKIFHLPDEENSPQQESERPQLEARVQALVANLLYAVEQGEKVRVVLTVRADFYDQCIAIEGLRRAFNGGLANGSDQINVGPLQPSELRRVIEGPLTAIDPSSGNPYRWSIEPELVTQLLADIGNEPGALPLLSHALLATWERRSGQTLTVAGYVTTGRVQGAIAVTANAVYAGFDNEEQELARVLFLSMARALNGERITSRQVHLSGTATDRTTVRRQNHVLDTLQTARLLVVDRQGSGAESTESVELAHEALTRVWPLLRDWMQQDRERQATYHRLLDGYQLWSVKQDDSDLYRGERLQTACALLDTDYRLVLDAQVSGFLEKSRKRQDAERLWRTVLLGAALVGVLVVAAILLVPPLSARIQQRQALALNPVQSFSAGDALLGSTDPSSSRYPQRPVPLSAFAIQRYEVSNAQYALCAKADVCLLPAGLSSIAELSALDGELPVVDVPVKQAMGFCAWLEGRLPTESEWERAARGGEGRPWPWADPLPPALGQANIVFTPPPSALAKVNDPAYQAGATPEGIMHLLGNAAEWTSTPASCEKNAYCNEVWQEGEGVIVRGGSFTDSVGALPSITQAWVYDGAPSRDIGFRCAFDEKEKP